MMLSFFGIFFLFYAQAVELPQQQAATGAPLVRAQIHRKRLQRS